MENENVFHVKKQGIMMRTHVSEDLRRHIVKKMVNYISDKNDVNPNVNYQSSSLGGRSSSSSSSSGGGGGGDRNSNKNADNAQDIYKPLLRENKVKSNKGKGCLGFLACFGSTRN